MKKNSMAAYQYLLPTLCKLLTHESATEENGTEIIKMSIAVNCGFQKLLHGFYFANFCFSNLREL